MKFRVFAIAVALVGALSTPVPSYAANSAICVAYDTGGPGDRSFNDAVFAGIKKSQQISAFTLDSAVTDGTAADREKRIRAFIAKGCRMIIVVGNAYAPILAPIAEEFPETQFAIINDQSIDAFNVASIVFDEKQGAFLAGVSAALSSKTGKVAMIASASQSSTYDTGFVAGVKAAKKGVRTSIRIVTASSSSVAKSLMATGVDVIYLATSGSADPIFEAVSAQNMQKKNRNLSQEVGLIVVEPDLYLNVTPSTAKYLLATVVKRVDKAIVDLISMSKELPILEVLDVKRGIYGLGYSISNKGVEIVIKSKSLANQTNAINSIASAAFER